MVDQAAYKHPEFLVLAMHVTKPGTGTNTIIAANNKKLVGKTSDEDDLDVIKTQKPVGLIVQNETRYEVLAPLKDVSGKIIGAMGSVVAFSGGSDEKKLLAAGIALRDELQEVIPSLTNLFDDITVEPADKDTRAECLTLKTLAHHPDLLVLAMHVKPPNESKTRIIAINVPKFRGRVSEDADQALAKNGNTLLDAFMNTHRVETHVAFRASDGTLIGTVATVYLWHDERELSGFLLRTIDVRDELQKQIPSAAALFEQCK